MIFTLTALLAQSDKWECADKWGPARCAKSVNKGYCAPVSECPSSKGFRCSKARKYCPVSCGTCPDTCAEALEEHKAALQSCASGVDCSDLVAIAVPEKCTDDELKAYAKSLTPCSKEYIVVGAGGGGAPMAYGLATAGCSVTVLEKGPDDTWEGTLEPTLYGFPNKFDLWNWETSWMYQANTPHPEISTVYWGENPNWSDRNYNPGANLLEAFGFNSSVDEPGSDKYWFYGADGVQFNDRRPSDKSMFMHHANIVGGNTMHNLGFWLRGDCTIYEAWGDEWSCDAMEATFDTIEAMYAGVMGQDDITNGPRAGYNSNTDATILQLFLDAGYTETEGRRVGGAGLEFSASWTEWSNAINPLPFDGPDGDMTSGSSRVTAAKVFIDPLRSLPNFGLITGAKVMKVNFDGTTATGVTYMMDGDPLEYTILADETILALGAVTTAQLLLVSGVGPAADLEAVGIPVVADLPVGAEYQNHVFNGALYCGPVWEAPSAGLSTFPADGIFKTYDTTFSTTTANVWVQGTSAQSPGPADYSMAFITNIGSGPFAGNFAGDFACESGESPIFVIIGVMYAHSRGFVNVSSASMDDYPVWQSGMFNDAKDAEILYEAFGTIRSILTPEAGFRELFPTDVTAYESHSVYGTSDSFWHDSSTAPIGKVVDSTLKVYGIDGLRVCDTSVQPWLTNMPNTAAAQATGLMGAKLVLQDAVKTPSEVEA